MNVKTSPNGAPPFASRSVSGLVWLLSNSFARVPEQFAGDRRNTVNTPNAPCTAVGKISPRQARSSPQPPAPSPQPQPSACRHDHWGVIAGADAGLPDAAGFLFGHAR